MANIDLNTLAPYVAGIIGAAGTWYVAAQQNKNTSRKEERSIQSQLYQMELQVLQQSRVTAEEVVKTQLNESREERKTLQGKVDTLLERIAVLESHQRSLESSKLKQEFEFKSEVEDLRDANECLKAQNAQLQAEIIGLRLDMGEGPRRR